jgi:D-tyrosyl-tRNA(Tyr) deacylase
MKNEPARKAYHNFLQLLRESYDEAKIHDGAFGEMMDVDLRNDGPVTRVIESDPKPSENGEEESAKSTSTG